MLTADPHLLSTLQARLSALGALDAELSAIAAHPPQVAQADWRGPAAEAQSRRAERLRRELADAASRLAEATTATRIAWEQAHG